MTLLAVFLTGILGFFVLKNKMFQNILWDTLELISNKLVRN